MRRAWPVSVLRAQTPLMPSPGRDPPNRPGKPEQCEKSPHRPVEIIRSAAHETICETTTARNGGLPPRFRRLLGRATHRARGTPNGGPQSIVDAGEECRHPHLPGGCKPLARWRDDNGERRAEADDSRPIRLATRLTPPSRPETTARRRRDGGGLLQHSGYSETRVGAALVSRKCLARPGLNVRRL